MAHLSAHPHWKIGPPINVAFFMYKGMRSNTPTSTDSSAKGNSPPGSPLSGSLTQKHRDAAKQILDRCVIHADMDLHAFHRVHNDSARLAICGAQEAPTFSSGQSAPQHSSRAVHLAPKPPARSSHPYAEQGHVDARRKSCPLSAPWNLP